MQLHCPAEARVLCADCQHKRRLELQLVLTGDGLARQTLGEDRFNFLLACRNIHDIFQCMVGCTAAHGIKECHALAQCFLQIRKRSNLHFGSFTQRCQIIEIFRLFQIHCLVRTPCRQNLYIKAVICCDDLVPLEIICRIIRRTNQRNAGLTNQIAHTHFRLLQLLIAQIPSFFCRICAEHTVIAKVTLQLQMTPMEQRVADCLVQSFCPFLELFSVRSAAGDVVFVYAVGTHLTPLVVVTTQPNLGDVFKLSVLRNFLRVDMAVII